MRELVAKPLAAKLLEELTAAVSGMKNKPAMTVLLVGEDPAAKFYIRNIVKKGEKIGVEISIKQFSDNISQDELTTEIEALNKNDTVNGIMLQKPLPAHIDENLVTETISPVKDIDGLTSVNLGKLMMEDEGLVPCTPQAVMQIIAYYGIELQNKHTVLCGRSNIVGKPLLNLLIRKTNPGNATVTVCHSRTTDLANFTRKADVLITAIGKAEFISKDMIKENVVIIDVGTNELLRDGKTTYVGDVNFADCSLKASAITPVPGGVGSITTIMLLSNLCKAYKLQE